MTVPRRIVVFTDSDGWHERQLQEAFERIDAKTIFVSLSECRFSDHSQHGGLIIPGLDGSLPDGVFVRSVSSGTFEQVTLRLGYLHALAEMSVKVVNSAKVIERTVDKSTTSHLLRRHGVATVPSWTFESQDAARQCLETARSNNKRLVLKPLFGSQGRGLRLLESDADIPPPEEVSHVYYLQEYVPPRDSFWRDWRIMVANGMALCAMERRSNQWITNRAQGAECLASNLGAKPLNLAQRAARAVGADYAGVDLIRTVDGNWLVLEINGVPAWQGIQSVSEVDIAFAFAKIFASATE